MWDIIGIILFCVGAFFIIMMFVADYKITQSVIDYAKFLGLSDDDDIEAEDECFKVIPQKTEEKPTERCKACDANMVTFDYDMNEWNSHW